MYRATAFDGILGWTGKASERVSGGMSGSRRERLRQLQVSDAHPYQRLASSQSQRTKPRRSCEQRRFPCSQGQSCSPHTVDHPARASFGTEALFVPKSARGLGGFKSSFLTAAVTVLPSQSNTLRSVIERSRCDMCSVCSGGRHYWQKGNCRSRFLEM